MSFLSQTPSVPAIHFTATLRSPFAHQTHTIFLFKDPFFTGSFPNIYNPVDRNGLIRGQVEGKILDFLMNAYDAHLNTSMHELLVTGHMDVTGHVTVHWAEPVARHVSQGGYGYY